MKGNIVLGKIRRALVKLMVFVMILLSCRIGFAMGQSDAFKGLFGSSGNETQGATNTPMPSPTVREFFSTSTPVGPGTPTPIPPTEVPLAICHKCETESAAGTSVAIAQGRGPSATPLPPTSTPVPSATWTPGGPTATQPPPTATETPMAPAMATLMELSRRSLPGCGIVQVKVTSTVTIDSFVGSYKRFTKERFFILNPGVPQSSTWLLPGAKPYVDSCP